MHPSWVDQGDKVASVWEPGSSHWPSVLFTHWLLCGQSPGCCTLGMTARSNRRSSLAGRKPVQLKSMNGLQSPSKCSDHCWARAQEGPQSSGDTSPGRGLVQGGAPHSHSGFGKLGWGKSSKRNDRFLILPEASIAVCGYNCSLKHHCFLILHCIASGFGFLF